MKITVKANVSQESKTFEYDLEDIGITPEEWENMSAEEKNDTIQAALDTEPEQPYWVVDEFSTEE